MTEDTQREARLRAIALNAVREARVAYGRDAGPWIDDDRKRMEMIFKLLHLAQLAEVEPEMEHFPVVAPVQAPPDPKLDAVGKLLDGEDLRDAPPPRKPFGHLDKFLADDPRRKPAPEDAPSKADSSY